ncbi:two-component system CAI-1 autoinducer sensor kinase/phosphatase CqsS [Luteibacter sp. Sphag1AF]|uniref:sensor histidine kinase n=1 Tax=Luteibacter sp. Sphag1AF TaxID=2587031 RepID=UPI00160F20FE|nr:HAMP domain-containing sensor histidine kinase [Luteibacter sp. Sphag1AF]MBB3227141.1 two-component system CAI-1 autoinducer sensor kinase/phosphatase CqsS [Luteibacter sp. Sphag1AF]
MHGPHPSGQGSGKVSGFLKMQLWLFLRALSRFETTMFARTRYSQPKMVAIGVVGCLSLAVYYPVWAYLFPQPYENLPLRLLCSATFLPLALLQWWPRRLKSWLPTYWYLAMTIAMPFFVGYMTLRNATPSWLMTHMACVMLLMMLFDVVSFLLVFTAGSLVATLVFILSPTAVLHPQPLLEYIPLLLFAMVGGAVCSVSSSMAEQSRLDALTASSNNIAHELRTPLGSLRIAAKAVGRFMPDLIRSHRLAEAEGLRVPELREQNLHALERSLGVMEREVTYANTIIDMLLLAARPIGEVPLQRLSARECVEQALRRFPYGSRAERDRITLSPVGDFALEGAESLFVHILFNLLRNALFHTGRAGKGEIVIYIEPGDDSNHIRVYDSGPGIPPDVVPRVFHRFYSYSSDNHEAGVTGLGIGLAFSRAAMEHMGGGIVCRSQWGEFTEFTLDFPHPDAGDTQ